MESVYISPAEVSVVGFLPLRELGQFRFITFTLEQILDGAVIGNTIKMCLQFFRGNPYTTQVLRKLVLCQDMLIAVEKQSPIEIKYYAFATIQHFYQLLYLN